jgi:hypothetical protein
MKAERLQLRLQNCLQTILEIHEFMNGQAVHLDIAQQLETLKDLITHFQPEAMTEADLERIEASTNHLLRELAKIFYLKKLGRMHPGSYH